MKDTHFDGARMATHLERLGPYQLERRIGRGGMGTVFAAVTDVTGEPVAVKVLTSLHALDDGFHDRFAAEIESLRLLNHPNIVRILGYGDEDGCRFYAMELVDGCSLQEAIDQPRLFPWQEAVRMGIQICRALKHAHDRGVIHRDIKPANLLLTADGTVKLSDFGIAKSFGNVGLTADGGVIGTAEYMSPEQADGKPATHRSDLYSLGGVMYAAIAGRAPFRAKTLMEMLQLQKFAEPDPLYRLQPDVPRPLNDLILQLLSKDPNKRMPSAMMTARALEALLAATGAEPAAPMPSESPSAPTPIAAEPSNGSPPPVELAVAEAATLLPTAPSPESDVVPLSQAPELARHQETSDFQLAPVVPKRPLATTPKPAPQPTFATRTFTPIGRHEESKPAEVEEQVPAWISPQTWGLIAAMIALGGLVWYWLQPPEAEQLYARIHAAAEEGKIERLIDVEHDIDEFLKYYPGDLRGREMQDYREEIELYRLERKFEFRSKFLAKSDGLSPAERAYIEAMSYVHLDSGVGRRKLQAFVDLYRDAPQTTKQARECVLLAKRQLARLDRQASERSRDGRELIERQLGRADEVSATSPEEADRIRRAVVELYADESWADDLVARARAALKPKPN